MSTMRSPSRRARGAALTWALIAGIIAAPAASAATPAAPAAGSDPATLSTITVVSEPTLEGAREVGGTLTVTGGVWEPADVTLSYSWSFGDGCCAGGPLDTTGPAHVITAGEAAMGFVGVTITASKDGYESTTVNLSSGRILPDVPAKPVATAGGLTAANRGTLSVTTEDGIATISIPGTGPGIMFYVYGYGLGTPLGFEETIDPGVPEFQDAYDIEVDYSALGPGAQRLTVQTASGRLVGWVWVDAEPLAPPVPDSSGLTSENAGGASSNPTSTPNVTTITVPGADAGDSVHLTAFSTPTSLGWYTVEADGTIRVDFSSLPAGDHKIAIVASDGTLLGWVAVTAVDVALAETGPNDDAVRLASVAALALLAGAAALMTARRGRRATSAPSL